MGKNEEHLDDPRIRFASERTLLAWIRTGLAMMGFGFVVARFGIFLRQVAIIGRAHPPRSPGLSLWIGTALVVLGVAVNLLAAAQHALWVRRLERGETQLAPRGSLGIAVAVVLAALGLAMAAYLVIVGH